MTKLENEFYRNVRNMIFEVSDKPIAPRDRMEEGVLADWLHEKNPFWVDGIPLIAPKSLRKDLITVHLKNELPKNYLVDVNLGTIDIPVGNDYLQETIDRLLVLLKDRRKVLSNDYPLGWWKERVCLFNKTMIYYKENEELFTLHEFLLYMISASKDFNVQKVHIGQIFGYDH